MHTGTLAPFRSVYYVSYFKGEQHVQILYTRTQRFYNDYSVVETYVNCKTLRLNYSMLIQVFLLEIKQKKNQAAACSFFEKHFSTVINTFYVYVETESIHNECSNYTSNNTMYKCLKKERVITLQYGLIEE